jgi:signal transduction histidine kinase
MGGVSCRDPLTTSPLRLDDLGPTPAEALRLAEAMRRLVGVEDVAALATAASTGARALLEADVATFVLAEEGEEILHVGQASEGPRGRSDADALSRWSLHHRQGVALTDALEDAGAPAASAARSLVTSPIPAGGVIGVLAAGWREPREVGDRERRLLGVLAEAAGIALGQTHLREDVERARGRRSPEEADPATPARMLAVLGHDLRSPLGAVANGLELLASVDGEAKDRVLALARRSLDRALRLIEQVMSFSRANAGDSLQLYLDEVDLAHVAREVVEPVRAQAPTAEIVLEAEATPTRCAPERVQEALATLVWRAVEQGESGSPVTVRVGGDAATSTIEVHNLGKPIPEGLRARVFDAFRRSEDTGISDSIGFGLHIARKIVLAHGGSIEVRSSEAEGTTFTVRLPRQAAA